jgi:glycosyltransferase
MSNNPQISIITVCRNAEGVIRDNIISVNNQEYKNIEHIFVDGLSTDQTVNVIRRNVATPFVLKSEPDAGIYSAMNKGIEMASGEYIIFLNSDDIFMDQTVISRYVEVIEEKKPGIIFSNVLVARRDNIKIILRNWRARPFRREMLKYGWMPPHPGVLVNKEIFNSFGGFDERFKISGDYDFLLRIFKGFNGAICYRDLNSVLMRSGGVSNNGVRNAIEKWREDHTALKKNEVGSFLTVLSKRMIKIGQFI